MKALITIKNFRSIEEATLHIREGLNVIVGANGAGKTNLLHALKFLSNVVTSGASLAMAKAGGPSRNFRREKSTIQFSVDAPLDMALYAGKQALHIFRWDLSVGLAGSDRFVKVKHESFKILAWVDGGLIEVFSVEIVRNSKGAPKGKFSIAPEDALTKRLFETSNWVKRSSKKSEIFIALKHELNEVLSSLKKRPQDASFLEEISNIHFESRKFFHDLISLNEFNISPEIARQSVDPMPVPRMSADGGGLGEVIGALESDQLHRLQSRFGLPSTSPYLSYYPYDMYLAERQRKNPLPEIVENLRAAVTSIDSLATEIDPSSGRRFVTFKSGDYKFRPQEVSDGTFKWLCLLVALFVPTIRVLLMEEPENFMHPWMQQRFIALARTQTKKSSGSVILSTHSVTVLNSLLVDELQVVYQVDGRTHVKRIENKEEIEGFLTKSSFGLGDIWVSGELGGVTGAQ